MYNLQMEYLKSNYLGILWPLKELPTTLQSHPHTEGDIGFSNNHSGVKAEVIWGLSVLLKDTSKSK